MKKLIPIGDEFFWAWVAEERRVHPDELALSLDDIYDFFATYCATDGI